MSFEISAELEAKLLILLREGRKIEAIKRLREDRNIGLNEAKQAVEQLALGHGMDKHGGEKPGRTAVAGEESAPLSPRIRNEIAMLLSQHKPIEAIKYYREATGARLQDAADAIKRMLSEEDIEDAADAPELSLAFATPGDREITAVIREEIVSLLEEGQKIEAIKRVREVTNLGLKEAKDAVEEMERGLGHAPAPAAPGVPAAPQAPAPDADPDPNDYEEQVAELLRAGNRGEAVRYYMAATGEPEARAKKAVDRIGMVRGMKKSGCFIATACCGAADAPEVMALTSFRDRRLLNSPAGRWLVRLYYFISPPVASFILPRPRLRLLVRRLLIGPLVSLWK